MGIERYIEATVEALRNDVLSALPQSPARDQLVNCIRVLARTAIAIRRDPAAPGEAYADESLPADLKQSFRVPDERAQAQHIAEDISVDELTAQGITHAAQWMLSEPWQENAVSAHTVKALLDWDKRQRTERLGRLAAAEAAIRPSESYAVSGAKLTEQVLLRYLREKLENPGVTIDQYRPLPGGRTRKTVVFRQTGQADWPEWLVVQCDPPPGYHPFPGVSSQFPVIEYAYRTSQLKVPRPLLLELDAEPFGTPFMIVERSSGAPPSAGIDFFAAPRPSEALALDIGRQLGILHGLPIGPMEKSVPVMLPDASGWPGDLERLMARIHAEFQGPSLSVSAAFAWMKNHVHAVRNTVSLVHGDYLQHNMLVEGEAVSAVLDWEGVRIGHPGEDLGYVRPMIEQMTTWDKFIEAYGSAGGAAFSREEADYFTLRAYILMLTHIAHSKNEFEAGRVDDIRAAEVGCSLAPLFINCVAQTMEKILARDFP